MAEQPNQANILAEKIEAAWKSFASSQASQALLAGSRPGWTAEVKRVMGDLGRSLGYQVAASGYNGAGQGEFLYDLVWYTLDGQGFFLSQPMVMECEWKIAPLTVADDDFQKLVQARADVRVWISTCGNLAEVQQHIENCEKQIKLFSGSVAGDEYVLVFFEWAPTKNVEVRRLTAAG